MVYHGKWNPNRINNYAKQNGEFDYHGNQSGTLNRYTYSTKYTNKSSVQATFSSDPCSEVKHIQSCRYICKPDNFSNYPTKKP